MARKLDLRTGKPVWLAYRAPSVPTARLARDIRTDVLIIGMGISGAMIAERLAAAGMDVIAIDRRGPMEGSTAATTALVQFEIDVPLEKLSRRLGRIDAERAWQRSRLAIVGLKARIVEDRLSCGLAERPSLYLAGDVLDADGLKTEAEARKRAGLHATFLSRAALNERFGIRREAAILSQGNLALDPRKLTASLLNRAAAFGARLHAPVEATTIEHSSSGVLVATGDGPTITAKAVVLATGYELMRDAPAAEHRIISTWAIATRRQKSATWPEQALVWEASDPYLYARTLPDGRVVCGGEDEEFVDAERRDALIAGKSRRIAARLKKLFPGIDSTAEFAWAGAFGTTATGLPFMGAVPRKPRLLAVMGYGGNGITYSQIASEVVSAALLGKTDSDADLFAFHA